MHRRPPTTTLFPYTSLFRSVLGRDLSPWVGRSVRPAFLRGHPAIALVQIVHGKMDPIEVSYGGIDIAGHRSEEHTSELQSHSDLVCRLLLEKKKHKSSDKTI